MLITACKRLCSLFYQKSLFSYLSPITLLKEPIHYLSDTKRHFACFCLFMNKVILTIVPPCVTTTRVQGLQHISSFYILFHADSFFRGRNNATINFRGHYPMYMRCITAMLAALYCNLAVLILTLAH